jgi:glycolate oxidase FAD binding subunit
MIRIDPADLVATAGAATTLGELDAALTEQNVWVALDPPGPLSQSLGSVLEHGAGGPLSALFGPPRDQVIGLSFVAGNGTRIKSGGRVVKNVAGFDLAKAVIGGWGAFGAIAEANLRLRARPESDETRAWSGPRDAVVAAAAGLQAEGSMLACCEVLSPELASSLELPARWHLIVRALGTRAGVREELDAAASATVGLQGADTEPRIWTRWRGTVGGWPVAARIGADPAAWPAAAALAVSLGAEAVGVCIPRGTVRARFAAGTAKALIALRAESRSRGWPVTIERADDATLRLVGIWGEMNAGALALSKALRRTLEPGGTQDVPLWAGEQTENRVTGQAATG